MELSTFSENIVTVKFERSGETVELKVNIDAIVPDYYDQLEVNLKPVNARLEVLRENYEKVQSELKRQEKAVKKGAKGAIKMPSVLSLEKELAEIQREANAERLTCPVKLPDGSFTALLKGWSITENGSDLLPSKENLMRLPPKAVEEIWERCIARANTVKKRVDEEDEETSESTHDGSMALRVVGQSG